MRRDDGTRSSPPTIANARDSRLPAPALRARRLPVRPGRGQGVGALQAARRPLDRSPQGAAVAPLHPGPELPGRQPARSRDRGAESGRPRGRGCRRDPHDSRQPLSGEGTRRARHPDSPADPAAARASASSNTPMPCSAWGWTSRAAASSTARHEAFGEVLRLDPSNEHALLQLQKLYEDQNQWSEAYRVRRELAREDEPEQRNRRHLQIQAFLENELGMQALSQSDLPAARKHFEAAIELDAEVAPAYLNLGDVKRDAGDMPGAVAIWEQLVASMPTTRPPGRRSPRRCVHGGWDEPTRSSTCSGASPSTIRRTGGRAWRCLGTCLRAGRAEDALQMAAGGPRRSTRMRCWCTRRPGTSCST